MGENIDEKVSQKIPRLMGYGEYARYRGVSLMAVQSQIKAGIITPILNAKGIKKIDVVKADGAWVDLRDLDKPKKGRSKIAPFAESRAIREEYAAKIAKLEYEEKLGTLVPAEKVKAQAVEVAQMIRNNLLDLPAKLAAVVASETDDKKIETILTSEITAALQSLADYGSKL